MGSTAEQTHLSVQSKDSNFLIFPSDGSQISPFRNNLHSGMGSIAEPTHLSKVSFQSKDSNILIFPSDGSQISPFRIDLHSGMGLIAEPTHLPKASFQSKDSNVLRIPSDGSQISPFRIDLHSGMAEWASLPKDILVLIAEHIDFFEDFFNFCLVCKSWQSVSSMCGKGSRTLPPRCPWVMLTDIAEMNFPEVTNGMLYQDMLAEEVEKNEHIDGMDKRRFFSFSTSKIYDFELPEATRKKCFGVSNGWLMALGYDLQINLLHPFSRLQVGLPPFLSFQDQFKYEKYKPQTFVSMFVRKAVMSSNPYNSSNGDCIVFAIYGKFRLLAFARPGDKVWTDIYPRMKLYRDVVYYKGKFYAIDSRGVIVVCDIHGVKRPEATPIARIHRQCIQVGRDDKYSMYLVESSGSLLVVVRFIKMGPIHKINVIREYADDTEDDVDESGEYVDESENDIDESEENVDDIDIEDDFDESEENADDIEDDVDTSEEDVDSSEEDVDDSKDGIGNIEEAEKLLHYTVGFSIFKLEECHGEVNIDEYPYSLGDSRDDDISYDDNRENNEQFPSSYAYPYKLIPVKNLGDNSLFLGFNASASLPSSDNVKANHIYFSDDESVNYCYQPLGGGPDTGMYDVESGRVTVHCASEFRSYLTPPMWYI